MLMSLNSTDLIILAACENTELSHSPHCPRQLLVQAPIMYHSPTLSSQLYKLLSLKCPLIPGIVPFGEMVKGTIWYLVK